MTNHEISKSPSPPEKAILHYLDQVKVLNLYEIDKIFTDDFVQSTRPLSLGIPSRTKQEDLAFLQGLSDQLGGRPMEVIHSDPLSPRAELTRRWDRLQSTTLLSRQGRLGPMCVNLSFQKKHCWQHAHKCHQ